MVFLSGSSEEEKFHAINEYLNNNFFGKIEAEYTGYGDPLEKLKKIYKYRMVFRGEREDYRASFSSWHSMLAKVTLNSKALNTDNVHPVVRNLSENVQKIYEFAYDNTATSLEIASCDRRYQGFYIGMLRHVLISDKNLPQNIDVNSIKKIAKDLTYVIYKK